MDRFLDKILVPAEGSCWIWGGSKQRNGYGTFGAGTGRDTQNVVRAHRFSYEHFIGTIPDGLQVDHLCRHRACVNPDHLELVTNRENTLRGAKPTALCPCGRVKDGHRRSASGFPIRYCKACARERSARNRAARRRGDEPLMFILAMFTAAVFLLVTGARV